MGLNELEDSNELRKGLLEPMLSAVMIEGEAVMVVMLGSSRRVLG